MKQVFGFIIFFIFISTLYSQDWKIYPYQPENSFINFPKDEGRHDNEPTEWWYTFANLKGNETGIDYTVMLTYFYRDTLIFDGLRILNISNETTGEFYHDALPVNYKNNSIEHLELEAEIFSKNRTEYWKTNRDDNGDLIPFNYSLHSKSDFGEINLNYDVIKRPLILCDSGFLHQGYKNYTYYYSFTEIDVTGELTLNGVTETVTGTAWFDKQYGNFHPEVEEKYEWLSLKLSNGIDINLWNIFNLSNQVPDNPKYRLFNCYINDSTTYNTSKFTIERLGYFYSPDSSRIYCKKFRIIEDELNLDIIVEVSNSNCEAIIPFPFYEGPITIHGTVGGEIVNGYGFGEILHTYAHPQLEIIEPNQSWNINIPIKWTIKNPDEGRPLFFDIIAQNENDESYKYLAKGIQDTFYQISTNQLALDSAYSFTIMARSIDTLLVDTIRTGYFYPNSIHELDCQNSYDIYPSPFTNNITIKSKNNELSNGDLIIIHSNDGKQVYKYKLRNTMNEFNIDLGAIESGIYIVNIINENTVWYKKILKR